MMGISFFGYKKGSYQNHAPIAIFYEKSFCNSLPLLLSFLPNPKNQIMSSAFIHPRLFSQRNLEGNGMEWL